MTTSASTTTSSSKAEHFCLVFDHPKIVRKEKMLSLAIAYDEVISISSDGEVTPVEHWHKNVIVPDLDVLLEDAVDGVQDSLLQQFIAKLDAEEDLEPLFLLGENGRIFTGQLFYKHLASKRAENAVAQVTLKFARWAKSEFGTLISQGHLMPRPGNDESGTPVGMMVNCDVRTPERSGTSTRSPSLLPPLRRPPTTMPGESRTGIPGGATAIPTCPPVQSVSDKPDVGDLIRCQRDVSVATTVSHPKADTTWSPGDDFCVACAHLTWSIDFPFCVECPCRGLDASEREDEITIEFETVVSRDVVAAPMPSHGNTEDAASPPPGRDTLAAVTGVLLDAVVSTDTTNRHSFTTTKGTTDACANGANAPNVPAVVIVVSDSSKVFHGTALCGVSNQLYGPAQGFPTVDRTVTPWLTARTIWEFHSLSMKRPTHWVYQHSLDPVAKDQNLCFDPGGVSYQLYGPAQVLSCPEPSVSHVPVYLVRPRSGEDMAQECSVIQSSMTLEYSWSFSDDLRRLYASQSESGEDMTSLRYLRSTVEMSTLIHLLQSARTTKEHPLNRRMYSVQQSQSGEDMTSLQYRLAAVEMSVLIDRLHSVGRTDHESTATEPTVTTVAKLTTTAAPVTSGFIDPTLSEYFSSDPWNTDVGDVLDTAPYALALMSYALALMGYALMCYALMCYALMCYALMCYALMCYALMCYALMCYALMCYACGWKRSVLCPELRDMCANTVCGSLVTVVTDTVCGSMATVIAYLIDFWCLWRRLGFHDAPNISLINLWCVWRKPDLHYTPNVENCDDGASRNSGHCDDGASRDSDDGNDGASKDLDNCDDGAFKDLDHCNDGASKARDLDIYNRLARHATGHRRIHEYLAVTRAPYMFI